MMEDKLEKLEELLSISTENVSANHWIPAIHEDKHEALAKEIVKLFAITSVSTTVNCEHVREEIIIKNDVPYCVCRKCGDLY